MWGTRRIQTQPLFSFFQSTVGWMQNPQILWLAILCYFKIARRDFKCSHHKGIISVLDDGYVHDSDLNSTQCVHAQCMY